MNNSIVFAGLVATGLFAQTAVSEISELPLGQMAGTGGLLAALVLALRWMASAHKASQERADAREAAMQSKLDARDAEIKELLKDQIQNSKP